MIQNFSSPAHGLRLTQRLFQQAANQYAAHFLAVRRTRPHVVNGLRAICCGCRRRLDFRLLNFLAAQMSLGGMSAIRDRCHRPESDGGLRTNVSFHPKSDRHTYDGYRHRTPELEFVVGATIFSLQWFNHNCRHEFFWSNRRFPVIQEKFRKRQGAFTFHRSQFNDAILRQQRWRQIRGGRGIHQVTRYARAVSHQRPRELESALIQRRGRCAYQFRVQQIRDRRQCADSYFSVRLLDEAKLIKTADIHCARNLLSPEKNIRHEVRAARHESGAIARSRQRLFHRCSAKKFHSPPQKFPFCQVPSSCLKLFTNHGLMSDSICIPVARELKLL